MSSEHQPPENQRPVDLGFEAFDILIDTNVYRREGMNLRSPLFKQLAQACSDYGLRVHTTEIILQECRRQISTYADQILARANAHARAVRQWNYQATTTLPEVSKVDPQALTERRFLQFRDDLRNRFGLIEHRSKNLDAAAVLDAYFKRLPPFLGESKEFPDAFIIQSAAIFAKKNERAIYLVSGDKLMCEAAGAAEGVIPIESLEALLSIGTDIERPEVASFLDELLSAPGVDDGLVELLADQVPEVEYVYADDDVYDPRVEDAQLITVETLSDFYVVSLRGEMLSFVCSMTCNVEFEVRFSTYDDQGDEEPSISMEQKEAFPETAYYRVLYRVDLKAMRAVECEILDRSINVDTTISSVLRRRYE